MCERGEKESVCERREREREKENNNDDDDGSVVIEVINEES